MDIVLIKLIKVRVSTIFKKLGTVMLQKNVAGSIPNFSLISPNIAHSQQVALIHTQQLEFNYGRLSLLACSFFQLNL